MTHDIKDLRIGVLMGGLSPERPISLISGNAVYKALKAKGANAVAIDIDTHTLDKIINAKLDVAFIALHGKYGEDGIMQSILEFLRVPYTGSGPLASALAMDKTMTQQFLEKNGILMPKYCEVTTAKEVKNIKLKYPVVLKPVDAGSAVGVFIVETVKEALAALPKVQKISKRVIIQEYIKGVEISVPVLIDKALSVIEIVPANKFYDFDAKYTAGKSDHIMPARIEKTLYKKAQEIAVRTHQLLGCRDLSRTDMIVSGKKIYTLECNTIPGFTPVSLFPQAAKEAGISFYDLIIILLQEALKRGV
ncbi:MAG: D-alanine--D-alanine ligase [bacterium]